MGTVKVYEPYALVELWMQAQHPDESIIADGILDEYAATEYDEIIRIIQEAGLDLTAIEIMDWPLSEVAS